MVGQAVLSISVLSPTSRDETSGTYGVFRPRLHMLSNELPRPLVIFYQLFRDPLRHIGTRPAELAALALLRGRPDHVAILVYQADGGDRFMLAFLAMA